MGLFDWFKKEKVSDDKLLEVLESLKKKEIRVTYQETNGELLDIAASKIGGNPALPADFIWPRYKGESFEGVNKERPLSFMAQINLRDVAMYDEEGILPKTGMLSFFYDLMTMKWGFEPEDRGCARVYYFPEDIVLWQTTTPQDLEADAFVPECKISFKEHISLPTFEDYKRFEQELDFDWDEYDATCSKLGYESDDWGDRTKLLGYADVIQNSMEEECETLMRGYGIGNPEDYAKIPQSEKQDIKEKSHDWMLLFQMGTIGTENSEIMFGDCGHIYFWIRKQDLKECNFDKVWLILQCG